jgi:hypothetical protein
LYAYGTRLYVPVVSTLRSTILYELHDAPTVGRRGITRLPTEIARAFWWPNMKRTVQHYYLRSCVICQRNKATRHTPYGLLQPHEVSTWHFKHVSFELIRGLPECDEYDVVVVFVCILTRRTIVEPITKTITTEQLAKVMHRVVFRHFGLPRNSIYDRDPPFMSDFWQALFRFVGTNLKISTSYHPHTYGKTERVN